MCVLRAIDNRKEMERKLEDMKDELAHRTRALREARADLKDKRSKMEAVASELNQEKDEQEALKPPLSEANQCEQDSGVGRTVSGRCGGGSKAEIKRRFLNTLSESPQH